MLSLLLLALAPAKHQDSFGMTAREDRRDHERKEPDPTSAC
jgi:hypothetical protein